LPASCDGVGFVCRFSFALALGVGHIRSISVRFPPLERVPEQARGIGQFAAFADGKDEQPLASVGRTDFRRRKEACRKLVAHADQSAGDFGEAEAEMMGDILKENEGRFAFANDPGDVRPEVAWILGTEALACDGERLARIARSDDIHCAAPRAAVEGSNVVPYWCVVEASVVHSCNQNSGREGISFDEADGSDAWHGDLEAKIESASTAAQAKHVHVGNSRTNRSPDCSCGTAADTYPESPAGSPSAAVPSAMSPSSDAEFRRHTDGPARGIPASSPRSNRICRHRHGSLLPSISPGISCPWSCAVPDGGVGILDFLRFGTGDTRTEGPDAEANAGPRCPPSGERRKSRKGRRRISTCP
jgi:hypothetical protein